VTRYDIRQSILGRIVVPNSLPAGTFLFYTTVDFDGRLNGQSVEGITRLIKTETGRDAVLATCHQVHGTRSATVTSQAAGWCESEKCDALFTSERDVALGIKVADCLPVTLVEPSANWTANIHAGWRGASSRIVESSIADARASHRLTRDAIAFLGPTIRQCCFEVGEEVVDRFTETFGDIEAFVDRSQRKPHVSISGIVTQILEREGFDRKNIVDTELCTRCDDSIFHSYRRNGENAGRNLAIVVR